MPAIITIDTSPSPVYIDLHHSTHTLTTLLHNDQLILVEVQGSLEYNLADDKTAKTIKLGDISWDSSVYDLQSKANDRRQERIYILDIIGWLDGWKISKYLSQH
jgi:hypothetical protein